MLKRGRYHNELTRFRYDVVLHVEAGSEPLAQVEWLQWEADGGLGESALREALEGGRAQALGIRGVPSRPVPPNPA